MDSRPLKICVVYDLDRQVMDYLPTEAEGSGTGARRSMTEMPRLVRIPPRAAALLGRSSCECVSKYGGWGWVRRVED